MNFLRWENVNSFIISSGSGPHSQVSARVVGGGRKPTSPLMIHVAAREETPSNLSAVVLMPLSQLANNTLECYGPGMKPLLLLLASLPLLFATTFPLSVASNVMHWRGVWGAKLSCAQVHTPISETNLIQPPTVWLAARWRRASCVEFITEPPASSGG